MSLFPVVARSQLHLEGIDFGIAMALLGLGAVLVSVFLLPRICSRYSIDQVVAVSAAFGALACAGLAVLPSRLAFDASLFVLGAASSTALASLNLGAQLSVPDWVRGRTSSVYLLLVQGTFALGALGWGYAAGRWGVSPILLAAAAGFVLTVAFGFFQPLPQLARMNLSASHHWPAFHLVTTLRADDGPVLVQIDYEIEPQSSDEFRRVMQMVRTIRLRDGGMRWVLLDDLAKPGHFRESFMVESWSEHLRQMERSTLDDAAIEARARSLQIDRRAPLIRHFLVTAPSASGALKPVD
jgi:MFS family permease